MDKSLIDTLRDEPKESWGSNDAVLEAIWRCNRINAIIRSEIFRRQLPRQFFDDVKSEVLLILIDPEDGQASLLSVLDKPTNIYTLVSGIAFRYTSNLSRSSRKMSMSIDTADGDDGGIILESLDVVDMESANAGVTSQDDDGVLAPVSAESFIQKMAKKGFPPDIISDGALYKRVGRPRIEV